VDWRTLLKREEKSLHQLSVSDAYAVVYRKGWDTPMIIKKTMPCGHKVEIEDTGIGTIRVVISTNQGPVGLGVRILPDKTSALIRVNSNGLPMIREILDELDPQPWPYRFLNSIRKRWYS
jgi:hypothetical protein